MGKGRGEREQVRLAYLGKRPQIANLREEAAFPTAGKRKNEFLEVTAKPPTAQTKNNGISSGLLSISFCPSP